MRIYQMVKSYIQECCDTVIPVVILFFIQIFLQVISGYISETWYLCSIIVVATAAILGAIYYWSRHYAYGTLLGGLCLYYLIYRIIYFDYAYCQQVHLMVGLIILNGLVIIGAILFKGRVLACIGIIGAFLVPWLFADLFVTMQMLIVYCMSVLAIVMAVSFVIDCFWLNILSFVGYLLYHETIFEVITVDPQYGVLTLNEVFFIMGLLFVLYTIVPIATTIICKEHFSQPLLMAIVGAYTFLVTEATVAYQLQRIHELPFFLKIWVKDIPSLTAVHVQMSWVYAAGYGISCVLLLFMNRHAKMMLASLLTLFCLSLIGLLYIHNFPFWELIAYHKKMDFGNIFGCGGWI